MKKKIIYYGLVYVIFASVLSLLASCRTINSHDSYAERHRLESVLNRMDSLWQQSQTTVQDTSWHETFIRKLQSIREHNDTSHTVMVDTAGIVIGAVLLGIVLSLTKKWWLKFIKL